MQLTKPSSTSSKAPLSRPTWTRTWKQSNARSRWPIDSKWSAASSSSRTLATRASRACAGSPHCRAQRARLKRTSAATYASSPRSVTWARRDQRARAAGHSFARSRQIAAAATSPAFSISRAAWAICPCAASTRARSTGGTRSSSGAARLQAPGSFDARYPMTVSAARASPRAASTPLLEQLEDRDVVVLGHVRLSRRREERGDGRLQGAPSRSRGARTIAEDVEIVEHAKIIVTKAPRTSPNVSARRRPTVASRSALRRRLVAPRTHPPRARSAGALHAPTAPDGRGGEIVDPSARHLAHRSPAFVANE